MLVKPSHLRGLRTFLIKQTNASTFREAFHKAMGLIYDAGHKLKHWNVWDIMFSFTSVLGHYLFYFHRKDYFWSIMKGAWSDLPIKYTCPPLRVAQHYGGG